MKVTTNYFLLSLQGKQKIYNQNYNQNYFNIINSEKYKQFYIEL